MKTIKIKVYQFDELSDEAKQKAINNLYDINVFYAWWDCTYEDAERIGLKITEFDLDRNRHAKGKFIDDPEDVANKILNEHGESCETYKTATNYLAEMDKIHAKYKDLDAEDDLWDNCEQEEVDAADEFLQSLLEDYSIMLQHECDYLMSEEAIIETIKCNEYDFTEDGKIY